MVPASISSTPRSAVRMVPSIGVKGGLAALVAASLMLAQPASAQYGSLGYPWLHLATTSS